jgi:hypothetical protein
MPHTRTPASMIRERINNDLKQHALTVRDWSNAHTLEVLHTWAARFNSEFALDIDTPAIAIDSLPFSRLGQYREGRNGLGIRHEITINTRHLTKTLAEQLATLFHEMLHEWQELYGKSGRGSYHNRQFRVMANKFGLVVNERGYHLAIRPGPFTQLLAKHNVDLDALPISEGEPVAVQRRPKGTSKLKKWSCLCTNVRCAVELRTRCQRCGMVFELAD